MGTVHDSLNSRCLPAKSVRKSRIRINANCAPYAGNSSRNASIQKFGTPLSLSILLGITWGCLTSAGAAACKKSNSRRIHSQTMHSRIRHSYSRGSGRRSTLVRIHLAPSPKPVSAPTPWRCLRTRGASHCHTSIRAADHRIHLTSLHLGANP